MTYEPQAPTMVILGVNIGEWLHVRLMSGERIEGRLIAMPQTTDGTPVALHVDKDGIIVAAPWVSVAYAQDVKPT
jgi:hypothetical protein